MVALALLALGMSVLLQVQARSIQLAQQGRALTVATLLARGKLLDCEQDLLKKGFSVGYYNESGKFDEDEYPSFFWECHGYQPDLPEVGAADVTEAAAQQNPDVPAGSGLESLGVGMIAPIVAQLSDILKQSIRELVVIVKWRDGDVWEEMSVTTHVVDLSVMRQVTQGIAQMSSSMGSGGLGGLLGLPGGTP